MAIPAIPSLKDLMEAGVHFGHASGKWHPKMKPYIFCTRDHLHIINLEKTQEQLKLVLPILQDRVRSGKSVVIVGTKKQVAPLVGDMAERLGISYVNERWLGGTLTNFGQMMQSIARMKRSEEILSTDEAKTMIKKERVMLQSELKRMHAKFGGLRDFKKKPDVLIIIDPSHEHNAVREGRFEGIEIFAVVDTNTNPDLVNHVIPANDDGPKSLKLIMGLIEETIAEGQKLISVDAPATAEKVDGVVVDTEHLEGIEDKLENENSAKKMKAAAAHEDREEKKKLKELKDEAAGEDVTEVSSAKELKEELKEELIEIEEKIAEEVAADEDETTKNKKVKEEE